MKKKFLHMSALSKAFGGPLLSTLWAFWVRFNMS